MPILILVSHSQPLKSKVLLPIPTFEIKGLKPKAYSRPLSSPLASSQVMAALGLGGLCSLPETARLHPLSPTHIRPSAHKGNRKVQLWHGLHNPLACQATVSPILGTVHQDVKKDPLLPFRVGHGFDLHRLEPNLPLIVGGVNIPHDRGCEAHSDGDVLLHCVVDAILGALGLPDIGQIFPDNDPKWKGAASSVFVKEAVRLMHEGGYELGNLDATLILQRPKVSPHKEAIRANLCDLLGADPSVVNLKAKTHEKLDSLGENRSIAAHTVVLLMKKQ